MATNDRAREDDAQEATARYRRAAEETLDQLEWCINYLYSIRKPRIAQAIAQNRSTIRRHMRAGDD